MLIHLFATPSTMMNLESHLGYLRSYLPLVTNPQPPFPAMEETRSLAVNTFEYSNYYYYSMLGYQA